MIVNHEAMTFIRLMDAWLTPGRVSVGDKNGPFIEHRAYRFAMWVDGTKGLDAVSGKFFLVRTTCGLTSL
jgi:hypothetical protein